MFPWFGNPQGGQPTGGVGGIPPWLMQMLMQRRGMPMQGAQQQPFDWSNPFSSLGGRFAQPFTDNSGLSSLWSPQVGQTQSGPMGWQTTTNRAQSPLGGLLGRIGGMFR
jgi:hypothetical protein